MYKYKKKYYKYTHICSTKCVFSNEVTLFFYNKNNMPEWHILFTVPGLRGVLIRHALPGRTHTHGHHSPNKARAHNGLLSNYDLKTIHYQVNVLVLQFVLS